MTTSVAALLHFRGFEAQALSGPSHLNHRGRVTAGHLASFGRHRLTPRGAHVPPATSCPARIGGHHRPGRRPPRRPPRRPGHRRGSRPWPSPSSSGSPRPAETGGITIENSFVSAAGLGEAGRRVPLADHPHEHQPRPHAGHRHADRARRHRRSSAPAAPGRTPSPRTRSPGRATVPAEGTPDPGARAAGGLADRVPGAGLARPLDQRRADRCRPPRARHRCVATAPR